METNTSALVMGVILLIATFDPIAYFMRLGKQGIRRMKLETAQSHDLALLEKEVWNGKARILDTTQKRFRFFYNIRETQNQTCYQLIQRYALQSHREAMHHPADHCIQFR